MTVAIFILLALAIFTKLEVNRLHKKLDRLSWNLVSEEKWNASAKFQNSPSYSIARRFEL